VCAGFLPAPDAFGFLGLRCKLFCDIYERIRPPRQVQFEREGLELNAQTKFAGHEREANLRLSLPPFGAIFPCMVARFGDFLPPGFSLFGCPSSNITYLIEHVDRIRFFATAAITRPGLVRIIEQQNARAAQRQILERLV
jgi:hypothetical protein